MYKVENDPEHFRIAIYSVNMPLTPTLLFQLILILALMKSLSILKTGLEAIRWLTISRRQKRLFSGDPV